MGRGVEAFKLAGIAIVWLSVGRFLPDLLWRALPSAVLDSLSLPAYSMLCQVLTTFVGLATTRLAFARPADALAVRAPSGWHLAFAAMLAPAVFVVASVLAVKIAEPFLIAELAREGAGVTRRNAGAFGRAITEAPLLLTLVWGAVFAAIAEELAFRGALFAAVEKGMATLLRRSETAPEHTRAWSWPGIAAVAMTAAAFGAMHADMKGSVGIVRVASATFLGLACGSARLASGTIFVSMLLHFGYNGFSLGLGRGFFRSDSDPLLSVVPNRLLAVAIVGILLAAAAIAARRASRGVA